MTMVLKTPTSRAHPSAGADLDRAADELQRDGATILRGLLDPALVASWADAFEHLVARREGLPGGLAMRGPGRFYTTLPWEQPFADASVFAHPAILEIVGRVLGPHHRLVQLASDTPVLGSEQQDMHRDFPPLFGEDHPTPLYALAVNFPLCRVDGDNGPFQMARGTHLLRRAEADEAVRTGRIPTESVHMELGDVMIRTPFQLHAGSPNRTARMRPMVVMGYVCDWLRTPNVELQVPRRYYDTLAPAQQRLLRCEVVDTLVERPETYLHFKH